VYRVKLGVFTNGQVQGPCYRVNALQPV